MPKDDIQGMFKFFLQRIEFGSIQMIPDKKIKKKSENLFLGIRAIYGPRTTTTAITTTTTSTVLANRIIHPCTEPIRSMVKI